MRPGRGTSTWRERNTIRGIVTSSRLQPHARHRHSFPYFLTSGTSGTATAPLAASDGQGVRSTHPRFAPRPRAVPGGAETEGVSEHGTGGAYLILHGCVALERSGSNRNLNYRLVGIASNAGCGTLSWLSLWTWSTCRRYVICMRRFARVPRRSPSEGTLSCDSCARRRARARARARATSAAVKHVLSHAPSIIHTSAFAPLPSASFARCKSLRLFATHRQRSLTRPARLPTPPTRTSSLSARFSTTLAAALPLSPKVSFPIWQAHIAPPAGR
ncbi:hypothetical protein BD413DRAFT_129979 [Trametes elegans]|nr:hypothetical protein BD413DRAFT_129979 [Trametes elegans]